MTQNTMKISDYINIYYREYSIHTNNNRAIPSIVDGFKPVQRKIIFCALKEAQNNFKKVSSLAGLLPSVAAYHHGNVPAEEAIVKMAQPFNQNAMLLKGNGTFGTRLVPIAGASRYIFAKLHDEFHLYFKDNDITPKSLDEDDHPEPFYYLPIIPMVLVNGVSGVSVGFYTNILPRSPKDITRACINHLEGKNFHKLKPKVFDFNGDFKETQKNKYICSGIIEHVKNTDYRITEVPIGEKHEKYIEHLDKLVEKGHIKSYTDDSDSLFDIKVRFDKNYIDSVDNDRLMKDLKLTKSLSETFCVVDDMNNITDEAAADSMKIATFDDEKGIIRQFCDFRLYFYDKRIQFNIDRLTEDIDSINERIRFIDEVIKGKIKVGDKKRSELVELLRTKNYKEDMIEKLISMPIYSLTTDSLERYNNTLSEKKSELAEWKKADSTQLYLKDLHDLQKKLKF
ncbi:DNA topoisomerase II subunit [Salicola phage SCTP-2]|nr:DNA topoisomerase II subunit [Salicola phage SCTP-2]